MSSHHFVREKQEPALIIANGQECSDELLGQLLEWNPYVVVLDNAIYRVMEKGIKPDIWMGDFDTDHDFQSIADRIYPLEIVHTPDQIKTDLEKALDLLVERGYPAANIVWATGRRADHTITNITNLVRHKHQIKTVIFDDYSRIFPLPASFEKWYPAGTPLSLIPVGTVEGIRTEGLKYELAGESLTIGYRTGSSNEAAKDGIVRITVEKGDLLLMECHD
ncbi:thiamine diphosphokinase [Ravibacter arvi]|uniref:Thiamine diphosphokinase n=1 Tax=Ravibacter arvi TaxID=2051041 RepID=A0ABP8MDK9_9BACT